MGRGVGVRGNPKPLTTLQPRLRAVRQIHPFSPDHPQLPVQVALQRDPAQRVFIQPLADRLRQNGNPHACLYHRRQEIPLAAAHRNAGLDVVLIKQRHQLAAEGEIFVVNQQRVLAEQFGLHRVYLQPFTGSWHQHAQRVAKERQRRQSALLLNGKGGHRHVQIAVGDRLLNG